MIWRLSPLWLLFWVPSAWALFSIHLFPCDLVAKALGPAYDYTPLDWAIKNSAPAPTHFLKPARAFHKTHVKSPQESCTLYQINGQTYYPTIVNTQAHHPVVILGKIAVRLKKTDRANQAWLKKAFPKAQIYPSATSWQVLSFPLKTDLDQIIAQLDKSGKIAQIHPLVYENKFRFR